MDEEEREEEPVRQVCLQERPERESTESNRAKRGAQPDYDSILENRFEKVKESKGKLSIGILDKIRLMNKTEELGIPDYEFETSSQQDISKEFGHRTSPFKSKTSRSMMNSRYEMLESQEFSGEENSREKNLRHKNVRGKIVIF